MPLAEDGRGDREHPQMRLDAGLAVEVPHAGGFVSDSVRGAVNKMTDAAFRRNVSGGGSVAHLVLVTHAAHGTLVRARLHAEDAVHAGRGSTDRAGVGEILAHQLSASGLQGHGCRGTRIAHKGPHLVAGFEQRKPPIRPVGRWRRIPGLAACPST
jgi:hypothetical protein